MSADLERHPNWHSSYSAQCTLIGFLNQLVRSRNSFSPLFPVPHCNSPGKRRKLCNKKKAFFSVSPINNILIFRWQVIEIGIEIYAHRTVNAERSFRPLKTERFLTNNDVIVSVESAVFPRSTSDEWKELNATWWTNKKCNQNTTSEWLSRPFQRTADWNIRCIKHLEMALITAMLATFDIWIRFHS